MPRYLTYPRYGLLPPNIAYSPSEAAIGGQALARTEKRKRGTTVSAPITHDEVNTIIAKRAHPEWRGCLGCDGPRLGFGDYDADIRRLWG